MNLERLTDFCKLHDILLDYRYDPRFGGGHMFVFMGRHGDGWVKFTRRVSDEEVDRLRLGWIVYFDMLLYELETDFLPAMKGGIEHGNGAEALS